MLVGLHAFHPSNIPYSEMTRPVKRLGKRSKAQKDAFEKANTAIAIKRKKSTALDDSGILADAEGEPSDPIPTDNVCKRIKSGRTIDATKVLTGRRVLSLASIGIGLSECIRHGRIVCTR
ncbi:unnamed protein product [Orchesella dallaii]|uniref:Uncharacterized protein n=1 Tax=Orchesella dallaii TaxID=48710 RepID=A0ABP1S149_9HEXA